MRDDRHHQIVRHQSAVAEQDSNGCCPGDIRPLLRAAEMEDTEAKAGDDYRFKSQTEAGSITPRNSSSSLKPGNSPSQMISGKTSGLSTSVK